MQAPMRMQVLGALTFFAVESAASAQLDINPADWSRPNVMVEGMRAQSRVAPRSQRYRPSANRTAQTCANGARMRAQGSRDPGLLRLARLCRQAGY